LAHSLLFFAVCIIIITMSLPSSEEKARAKGKKPTAREKQKP
jgi:hypothetical protein